MSEQQVRTTAARDELARLTAVEDGEPTDEEILDAWQHAGAGVTEAWLFRAGVAYERARQQPAQDRATDEELVAIFENAYEHGALEHIVGIRAVAAHVRGERCLVARAVGDQLIDSVSIDRVTGGRIRVRVVRRRDPIANPDGESVEAFCKRRSDVPATLARLLGEVSRG